MSISSLLLKFTISLLITFAPMLSEYAQKETWRYAVQPHLHLPTIDITSPIKRFFLGVETWEIDPWEAYIGHFEGTAWLNQPGNMVLGGHVEYPDGTAGVFHQLHRLRPNDPIVLIIGQRTEIYHVVDTYLVDFNDLTPVYPTTFNQITLITCDESSYNPVTRRYNQRLVVVAQQEEEKY